MVFDPISYLTDTKNADLLADYKTQYAKDPSLSAEQYATTHYNTYGINEANRVKDFSAPFDSNSYLKANADVMANVSSGSGMPTAGTHYALYGINEGRNLAPTATPTEPIKTSTGFQPYSFLSASGTAQKAPYTMQPSSTFVPKEATVQWQLDQLLNKDSDYIKLARSNAMEQANKAGMLGSTMAAGAGQRAAIQSALDVAKPDALTYGTSALEGQKNYYDNEQAKLESLLQSGLKAEQGGYDYDRTLVDAQNRIDVQKLSSDTQARSEYAAQIMTSLNNLNKDIANIQMNTTMNPDEKKQVISDMRANFDTSVSNMASALGFKKVGTSWTGSTGGTGYNYTPMATTSGTSPPPVAPPTTGGTTVTPEGNVVINGVTFTKVPYNAGTMAYYVDSSGNKYDFNGTSMIPIE